MLSEMEFKEVNTALNSYLMKKITDVMPDRHFLIDESGIVHCFFGNVRTELFYHIENFELRSVFEFTTSEIALKIKQKIAECLSESKIVSFEYSLSLSELKKLSPTAVGPVKEQWFELKIYPINSLIEKKRVLVCSNRNITERKLMEQKLHEMAVTDPLTGLYNRRHAMQELENCFQRCKRYTIDVSVLMIDIDYFKKINDNYGHDIGDLVLLELSNFLKNEVRKVDIISRLGGEEFLIVMPDSSIAKVEHFTQRLIKKISEIQVATPNGNLSFTVSGGLSQIKPSDISIDTILKRVDTALYHSKENGRNQITTS
ncbi:sensor domain-containing diguanylate cyclase [Psychromonas aquimarina]|uniref:sensor domain-containing diguanylate cyclase n=1 Tax=Psychromonas aquimarina TaxID=444919 RepID=UPI000411D177|nr:GGDEF domain-containing protein [Psychromonas aquimarina]